MKIAGQYKIHVLARALPAGYGRTGALLSRKHAQRLTPKFRRALGKTYMEPGDEVEEHQEAERPEGLVSVPVRAISADVVPGWWVDHRDEAHLQAAVPLFERVPHFPNHWGDPALWLGYATEPEWDDTKLGANKVPGINVVANFDPEASEKAKAVARGVAAYSLTRFSAGFEVITEPSHPEMDCDDFWWKLGSFDEDGKQYLWEAKEIPDVHELSPVDVGAIESARTLEPEQLRQQVQPLARKTYHQVPKRRHRPRASWRRPAGATK